VEGEGAAGVGEAEAAAGAAAPLREGGAGEEGVGEEEGASALQEWRREAAADRQQEEREHRSSGSCWVVLLCERCWYAAKLGAGRSKHSNSKCIWGGILFKNWHSVVVAGVVGVVVVEAGAADRTHSARGKGTSTYVNQSACCTIKGTEGACDKYGRCCRRTAVLAMTFIQTTGDCVL
jgi:hypothetical protein